MARKIEHEESEVIIEKSNEELLRELRRKQLNPAPGEEWNDVDREKLLELEKMVEADEQSFSDVQRARLSGLRQKQFTFADGEMFTPDEVNEFEFLAEQEEKAKKV